MDFMILLREINWEIAERLKVTFADYRRLMTYYNCAIMEVEIIHGF